MDTPPSVMEKEIQTKVSEYEALAETKMKDAENEKIMSCLSNMEPAWVVDDEKNIKERSTATRSLEKLNPPVDLKAEHSIKRVWPHSNAGTEIDDVIEEKQLLSAWSEENENATEGMKQVTVEVEKVITKRKLDVDK